MTGLPLGISSPRMTVRASPGTTVWQAQKAATLYMIERDLLSVTLEHNGDTFTLDHAAVMSAWVRTTDD